MVLKQEDVQQMNQDMHDIKQRRQNNEIRVTISKQDLLTAMRRCQEHAAELELRCEHQARLIKRLRGILTNASDELGDFTANDLIACPITDDGDPESCPEEDEVKCADCWHKHLLQQSQPAESRPAEDADVYHKALQWLVDEVAGQAICCFIDEHKHPECDDKDCKECIYQTALHRVQHEEPKGGL